MTVNVAQVATELWVNGGSASYSTQTPSVVQSAYARGNSTVTATLGSTPTAGNLLVAIVIGSAQQFSMVVAADDGVGWGINSSLQSVSGNFSAVLTKSVATGDTGISISGLTGYVNVAVYEIANSTGVVFSTSAANTTSGTTSTQTGSFPTRASNTLRLLALGWQSALSVNTPTGYTALSPSTWNSGITAGADAAIIYEAADPTSTGPVTVTTSITVPADTSIFQVVDIQGLGGGSGNQVPQVLQYGSAVNPVDVTYSVSLPNATMSGNLLLLVVISSTSPTTPSGWTLESSAGPLSIYSRTAPGGTVSASIAGSFYGKAFIIEITNFDTPTFSSGSLSDQGSSVAYAGPLSSNVPNFLNILAIGSSGAIYPNGQCFDWNLLSPSSFYDNESGNYDLLIFLTPGYYSGESGVSLSQALASSGNDAWVLATTEVGITTTADLGPGGGGGPYPPSTGQAFVAVMG